MVHAECKRAWPIKPTQQPWRNLIGWFLTLNFVCLCWILFRAPSFDVAWLMVRRYLLFAHGGSQSLPLWLGAIGPVLLLGQWLMRRLRIEGHTVRLPLPWYGLTYGAAWALALSLLPLGYRPFIYFQF